MGTLTFTIIFRTLPVFEMMLPAALLVLIASSSISVASFMQVANAGAADNICEDSISKAVGLAGNIINNSHAQATGVAGQAFDGPDDWCPRNTINVNAGGKSTQRETHDRGARAPQLGVCENLATSLFHSIIGPTTNTANSRSFGASKGSGQNTCGANSDTTPTRTTTGGNTASRNILRGSLRRTKREPQAGIYAGSDSKFSGGILNDTVAFALNVMNSGIQFARTVIDHMANVLPAPVFLLLQMALRETRARVFDYVSREMPMVLAVFRKTVQRIFRS